MRLACRAKFDQGMRTQLGRLQTLQMNEQGMFNTIETVMHRSQQDLG
jgi:hypothetical protein